MDGIIRYCAIYVHIYKSRSLTYFLLLFSKERSKSLPAVLNRYLTKILQQSGNALKAKLTFSVS